MNVFIKLILIVCILSSTPLIATENNNMQTEYTDYAYKLLLNNLDSTQDIIWQKPPVLHLYTLKGIPSLNLLQKIKSKYAKLPLFLYREYRQGGYLYHIFAESYNIEADLLRVKKIFNQSYAWWWKQYETVDVYKTAMQFINIDIMINSYQSLNKSDILIPKEVLSKKDRIIPINPDKNNIARSRMHFYSNPLFMLPQEKITDYKKYHKIAPKKYEVELKRADKLKEKLNLGKDITGVLYSSLTCGYIKYVDYSGLEALGFLSYNISEADLILTQIGLLNYSADSQKSTNYNLNFGYRNNLGTWGYGFNLGYDLSLPDKFQRCSFGGGIFYRYCYFSANVYFALSDWKKTQNNNNKSYKVRPANSADAKLKIILPMYTPVSINLYCKLDLGEEFIIKKTQPFKTNIFRFDISLEYSPIDLIKLYSGIGYSNSDTTITYVLGIKLFWGITVNFKDQIAINLGDVYKSINYSIKASNIDRNSYIRPQQTLAK